MKKLLAGLKDARKRHKERHQPTGFDFAFADKIQFLNGIDWDIAAASAGFFLSRRYLSFLEGCPPERCYSRYAVIYRNGAVQAAVAVQVLEISGDKILGKPRHARLLARALSPAARKAGAVVRERVMVCGNLFSWGCHGVGFAPGTTPAALWPAVVEALYRIRRAERLSGDANLLFIKELTAAQHESAQVLRRFSYRPIETEPDMVLDLKPEWRSYADYVGGLDRKYRKSAQQIAKDIEASGCTLERVSEIGPDAARLHSLYLEVHEHASVRPVTLAPEYLPALARAAAEDFACIVIRRAGEILGFVTLLRDGETAVGYYIGYDRAAAAGLPLYLRLLHAVVEQSIEWGCRRLSLGRTALEPKARLGAKPHPLYVWARHRHPTVNFFVRKLTHVVRHEEAPDRNPFKAV